MHDRSKEKLLAILLCIDFQSVIYENKKRGEIVALYSNLDFILAVSYQVKSGV